MTHKVGPKGQVVLPKPLRSELGIQPGDEVLFEREGVGIRVWKAPVAGDLWGSLPAAEIDPLRTLMEEKRREREREDRGRRSVALKGVLDPWVVDGRAQGRAGGGPRACVDERGDGDVLDQPGRGVLLACEVSG